MFGVEQRHSYFTVCTKSGKNEESDRKMGEKRDANKNCKQISFNRDTKTDVFSIKTEHNGDKKYKQNIITE